ncbi:hypothetical protein LZ009_15745 [Ramlibacter sp. XY19]|uniref:hypothetical protein n=1 Tax=Ramlibacter paludis TaxID=2908000 RepID=UPI0023DAD935|nr:hypothetical protein [Ramlibacter paludis]MCG2594236.1 hypothetical protein [Ramlibacter paludis]
MPFLRRFAFVLLLVLPSFAFAAGALGPAGLRARHASLAPQLAENAFGGPLVLQYEEAGRRSQGDVYAVLEHPFAAVSTALTDPGQWCEILILHLNTKYCRRSGDTLDVRVGKKEEQKVDAATQLRFAWQPPAARPDYFVAQMVAPDGPYDTRDYLLLAEAVPLDDHRTLLHMGYALSYGGASSLAMRMYLATIAHDKVGFSKVNGAYVGGQRGVVERNTMRYYLAIDAYLRSLAVPPAQQLERRLQAWFDATEKYPRQLHEVERDDYLRMKRKEVARQLAAR